LLGQRLHVAHGNCAKQDQLQHLVVGERIGAGLAETRAQPVTVPVVVWRRFGKTGIAFRRHGPSMPGMPDFAIGARTTSSCRRAPERASHWSVCLYVRTNQSGWRGG